MGGGLPTGTRFGVIVGVVGRARSGSCPDVISKSFIFLMFSASRARGARLHFWCRKRLCFPCVLRIPGARSAPVFLESRGESFIFLVIWASVVHSCGPWIGNRVPKVMVMVMVMGGGVTEPSQNMTWSYGGGVTEPEKQVQPIGCNLELGWLPSAKQTKRAKE